jgi:hypothetical protein
LCEFFVVSDYDEMNCNIVFGVFTMYYKVQIMIICNNHEFDVGMNGSVKFVETKDINSEHMHVKCKYVVIVV